MPPCLRAAKSGSTWLFILQPNLDRKDAHLTVHWYEEPTLREQFGADYEAYLRTVPGGGRGRDGGRGRATRVNVLAPAVIVRDRALGWAAHVRR